MVGPAGSRAAAPVDLGRRDIFDCCWWTLSKNHSIVQVRARGWARVYPFFCVLYCAIIVVLAFEVSTDNSQKEREISLEYENSVTLLIMYIYFCGTPTHFRALVGAQSFMSVGWMICTKVCKDNLTPPRQVL